MVLHFEGPRAKGKQRSRLLVSEILIFGSAPTVETIDKWGENWPTEEEVRAKGVVHFMIRKYA